jgi:hypothetical protein
MDQNENNPGNVERQMDDSTGGRSEGERLHDQDDMTNREGMAGAGTDRQDGSYGNDSGFSDAGTEGERPAPGRTENGGIGNS